MHTVADVGFVGKNVCAGYGRAMVIRDVTVQVARGECVAIVGPNGAGKTTLLKTLSGHLKPRSGEVRVDGRRIDSFARRELARLVAVVPQQLDIAFGFTAHDVVMLGRTPYLGIFGTPALADIEATSRAMAETDVQSLSSRLVAELSGGEQQRVILAMALAQETPYLLLDEPTVHLDLGQQWRLMQTLTDVRARRGAGVLAIVHDLSLAGSYFDRVILLRAGAVVASGSPGEVLTATNISRVFAAPVTVLNSAGGMHIALDPGNGGPSFALQSGGPYTNQDPSHPFHEEGYGS